MTPSDWERFFNAHAPLYMTNCFTTATDAEVAFITQQMDLPPGSRLLDMGCGVGRHSIELARHGYCVTGVDLSEGMLLEAARRASDAGVQVDWVQCNALDYHTPDPFDGAICVCEGSFGLLGETDDPVERDLNILRNIHDALKPGAPFILTALNACRPIRQYGQSDIDSGLFDPIHLVTRETLQASDDADAVTVTVRERSFVPTELSLMCRVAGFDVDHVGGGTAGQWGIRPLDLDEMEIMVIAHRR